MKKENFTKLFFLLLFFSLSTSTISFAQPGYGNVDHKEIDIDGEADPLGCCYRCSAGKIVSIHTDVTEATCDSYDGGPGYHYQWSANNADGSCPIAYGDSCNFNLTPSISNEEIAFSVTLPPSEITLYPNPFTRNLHVIYGSDQKEKISIRIFDLLGKEVYLNQFNIGKGTNRIDLTLGDQLVQGTYLLQLTDSRGNQVIKKLIRN